MKIINFISFVHWVKLIILDKSSAKRKKKKRKKKDISIGFLLVTNMYSRNLAVKKLIALSKEIKKEIGV